MGAFKPFVDDQEPTVSRPTGPTPRPVKIGVLTVSDTRNKATDTSGALLIEKLEAAGHVLAARAIIRDDREGIDKQVRAWCADPELEAVIITGGTGITGRDVTVDVLEAMFDKQIPGFGELFRLLSFEEIGASTIQSRATGGVVNGHLVFALPGSTQACRLAWERILEHQLDARSKPCNLVVLLPRLFE